MATDDGAPPTSDLGTEAVASSGVGEVVVADDWPGVSAVGLDLLHFLHLVDDGALDYLEDLLHGAATGLDPGADGALDLLDGPRQVLRGVLPVGQRRKIR